MSRKRRFIFALGSGYIALVANIVYIALAIPLALSYLTKEEFGLWSVVLQITGYLGLLDLGVGQSVARLLIDSKDNINEGTYGSVLKTAVVVFAIQAFIVCAFGFLASHAVACLMHIPPSLMSTFEALLRWQCLAAAVGLLSKPFGYLQLWSHQRSDLGNFTAVAGFIMNFVFLWIGFKIGLRTFSLLLSSLAGNTIGISLTALAAMRLQLFPARGRWGALSWKQTREVFSFGRDLFVINLASQLISASQLILVSRLIGLDAAAVWSVCIKTYNMAQLVVFRIWDFSGAAFSEMVVRHEVGRFRSRLALVVAVSAVGAGFFGVLGAFGNRGFVNIWTAGKVSWDTWSDIAAAAYLFCFAVTRCYTGLIAVVKQIGNYKYISLLEGVLVVGGSIAFAPRLHFFGVLFSSLVANLLCSGVYGVFRVSRYFNSPIVEITFGWLKSACLFVTAFALIAFCIFWLGNHFRGPLPFLITASSAGSAGIALAFFFGLPGEFRNELIHFGKKLSRRILAGKRTPILPPSAPVISPTIEKEICSPSPDADRLETYSH
jgi:O-antigen/teichoic acid export membrane protein